MKPLDRRAKQPIKPRLKLQARSYRQLVSSVIELIDHGKATAGRAVNSVLTATYWLVGKRIVEHEQSGSRRAGYGEQLVMTLAEDLTDRFGRGFSQRNLEQMRLFYLTWQKAQTVSAQLANAPQKRKAQTLSAQLAMQPAPVFPLSWSHYVRLLSVADKTARRYYEREAIGGGWSVRQLDRQIASLVFQRTRGRALRGSTLKDSPEDAIRDPYVLEFLGLKDEYSETDLEESLIRELEHLLLEFGNDFTFVARQKRLRVGDEWYRVDLVFFHRRLRCLVIVDLKIGKFTHADAGQMNMYLNYAQEHWTHKDEHPPIGMILCSEKDAAVVRYSLGNLKNKVLARQYQPKNAGRTRSAKTAHEGTCAHRKVRGLGVPLHPLGPPQKPQQLVPLFPAESPKLTSGNLVRMPAPVRLNPPAQIGAPPRCKAIAFGGLPKEADQKFYLDADARADLLVFAGVSGVA